MNHSADIFQITQHLDLAKAQPETAGHHSAANGEIFTRSDVDPLSAQDHDGLAFPNG